MASFSVWDYLVLGIVLMISAGIGVYYKYSGGKQKTNAEYLLANRSISTIPVSLSLMSSIVSSIAILGGSMESYQNGTGYFLFFVGVFISAPIVNYIMLPVFYNLEVSSLFEYFNKRFGYTTRLYTSLIFSVQTVLIMGIVLFAPVLALEAATGIDRTTAICLIGLVCTFYSTIGGMKAVILTDVFQSILMFVAVFGVIAAAIVKAGGISPILEVGLQGKRIAFPSWSLDYSERHTVWSLLVGGTANYLSLNGATQTNVQRLLAAKSLESAKRAVWCNTLLLMLLQCSIMFSGVCIYWYYSKCDPLLTGEITSRDQIMPLFFVETMSHIPGVCGLFVSGIFSGSLSTVSSALNSLAAVTVEDYLKPSIRKFVSREIPEKRIVLLTKLVALIFGVISTCLAFLAQYLQGILQTTISLQVTIGGTVSAAFLLGMTTVRASQKGVLLGITLGVAYSMVVVFGGPKPPRKVLSLSVEECNVEDLLTNSTNDDTDYHWFYNMSYLWQAVISFFITMVTGYIFSLIFQHWGIDKNEKIYVNRDGKLLRSELFAPFLQKRIKERGCAAETEVMLDKKNIY
ncbi:hypothetical protein ACFFRR_006348 [Megaselia abdita]